MDEQLSCEVRLDGSGAFCCNEFVAAIENPEEDGFDSGKPYYIDRGRVYDARGARIVECPFCKAEIHTRRGQPAHGWNTDGVFCREHFKECITRKEGRPMREEVGGEVRETPRASGFYVPSREWLEEQRRLYGDTKLLDLFAAFLDWQDGRHKRKAAAGGTRRRLPTKTNHTTGVA